MRERLPGRLPRIHPRDLRASVALAALCLSTCVHAYALYVLAQLASWVFVPSQAAATAGLVDAALLPTLLGLPVLRRAAHRRVPRSLLVLLTSLLLHLAVSYWQSHRLLPWVLPGLWANPDPELGRLLFAAACSSWVLHRRRRRQPARGRVRSLPRRMFRRRPRLRRRA